ncbi:hypothetical protein CCMA1212_009494 [Trichoderma ghanense]|uniref:Uncharacterized protein n=1 Tax=Trichoderma ghanense TaxID=65468 RepID=A0ABY2GUT8_9HYPO
MAAQRMIEIAGDSDAKWREQEKASDWASEEASERPSDNERQFCEQDAGTGRQAKRIGRETSTRNAALLVPVPPHVLMCLVGGDAYRPGGGGCGCTSKEMDPGIPPLKSCTHHGDIRPSVFGFTTWTIRAGLLFVFRARTMAAPVPPSWIFSNGGSLQRYKAAARPRGAPRSGTLLPSSSQHIPSFYALSFSTSFA